MDKKIMRVITLLTALLIAIAIFSACKEKNNDSPQDDVEPSATEDATVNIEEIEGIPFFANGEYHCKLIRAELAEDYEKDVYGDLRSAVRAITGVNCPYASDFVGMGETLDTDSPAILIGATAYAESKQVYQELGQSEYIIKVVGNKLVVAFDNEDAAALALKKLEALISASNQDGVIAITEEWNSNFRLSSEIDGFPKFDGAAYDKFDAGDGSTLIAFKHVSRETHDAFVGGMESCGYTFYTDNQIGENLFYTYHNEKSIVNIMYLPAIAQTRVVIDRKDFSELAGLESENDATPGESKVSFSQLGLENSNAGGCQNGMAYVIKLSDGSFVVIDGGHTEKMSYADSGAQYLLDSMKTLADDPDDIRVHTWFISHLHHDHMGALYDLARKMPESLTIDRIVYNAPNELQLGGVGSGNLDNEIEEVIELMNIDHVVKAHPGQVLYAREAKFTIFGGLDLVEPIKINNVNDTCMVMQMEFMGKTIMFLGDCHPNESKALTDIYGNALKSDFIQLSHHGYAGSATLLINQLIDAEASFWPVGNKDYKGNVSKVSNVPANEAFVGIPHYVAGNDNLTVTDFETWVPDEKRWTPYD